MKTFMSVAALCLLASANAEGPFPFNAAISISDSSGTARATSLRLDGPEGELSIVVPNGVYTQVDGHAYATALTEGDGTAAAMAEQDGEGHAESDLSAAESTNYIYARAFKDAEEAIAYSDSEGTTHTITESPVGRAVAWTGDGIFEEDGMFDGIIEFPIRDGDERGRCPCFPDHCPLPSPGCHLQQIQRNVHFQRDVTRDWNHDEHRAGCCHRCHGHNRTVRRCIGRLQRIGRGRALRAWLH